VSKLTKGEILRIVDGYLTVIDWNLVDFTHFELSEFFPRYSGLEIDYDAFEGSKRARFITILENLDARDQARVLRGLLEAIPPAERPTESQRDLGPWIENVARRLEGDAVAAPTLEAQYEVLTQAIADTETLIRERGPTSAVDRLHTALHAYMKQICREAGIDFKERDRISDLYRKILREHPIFGEDGPQSERVRQLLRSLTVGIDALDPIRNRASLAHPNEELLGEQEAIFVRNAVNTILTYLNAKLRDPDALHGDP
jgi:hypothetical protein